MPRRPVVPEARLSMVDSVVLVAPQCRQHPLVESLCILCSCQVPRNPHHPLHTSSSMQSLRTYVRTIAIVASIASVVDILIDSSLDVSICIRNHHVRTYVCSSILDASISISTTYCLRRRHHHLSSLRTYSGSPGFAICPRTHIPRTYVRTQLAAPSHTTSPMSGWGQAKRRPRPDVQVGSHWVSKGGAWVPNVPELPPMGPPCLRGPPLGL